PRLAAIGPDGEVYLHADETEAGGGLLLIFNRRGQLQNTVDLGGERGGWENAFDQLNEVLFPVESRAASIDQLQIDHLGNVYSAVSDAREFHVVRWCDAA